MKSFLFAVFVVLLLLGGIIVASSFSIAEIDRLYHSLPEEDSDFGEAALRLCELSEELNHALVGYNSFIPHELIDSLDLSLAGAAAAAACEDTVEYRIHLAEAKTLLEDMRRELSLCFSNLI